MKKVCVQTGGAMGKLLALLFIAFGGAVAFAPEEVDRIFAEMFSSSSQSVVYGDYESVAASRGESLGNSRNRSGDSWAGARPESPSWDVTRQNREKLGRLKRDMDNAYNEFVRASQRNGSSLARCGSCYSNPNLWDETCYWYCQYTKARDEIERIRQGSNFRTGR